MSQHESVQQQQKNEQNDEIDEIKNRKSSSNNNNNNNTSIIKKKKHNLSFQDEIDQIIEIKSKVKKNPSIKIANTIELCNNISIDQQLKNEYLKQIQKIKQQFLEFQYSYWDGHHLIKKLRRKKQQKIINLIQLCRLQLITNYHSLAEYQPNQLLLIIKDFIAPHNMKLCQIEVLRLTTTKNDPLLNLSHTVIKKHNKELKLSINHDGPFRIIERSKYQKNRTAYPFCNWHTIKLK